MNVGKQGSREREDATRDGITCGYIQLRLLKSIPAAAAALLPIRPNVLGEAPAQARTHARTRTQAVFIL